VIGRTIMAMAAGLVLGWSVLVSPPAAEAKSCSVLCKSAIKECKNTICGGITSKKEKRTCFKTTCRRAILDKCKPLPKPRTACSPSGAFVE
jgi:hypothetical protein